MTGRRPPLSIERSEGEERLAFQLRSVGIAFAREVAFAPGRRWRLDFVIGDPADQLAVEVDGGAYTGGHRRREQADGECEKCNAAALDGWVVLHFTPAQVERGEALAVIESAAALFEGNGGP